MILFPKLEETIQLAISQPINEERKAVLQTLIDYVASILKQGHTPQLNFICTHNSRRSQFAQIWAQTAAAYFGIPLKAFSGGVEVTEFNSRAVETLKRQGFQIASFGRRNPRYEIKFNEGEELILAFSKLYDDIANPSEAFAAVMTCADADENCPFIPGSEARTPLRYEDPKAFDNTPFESSKYQERSLQIASEMFYVFGCLRE
ncbi:protein-tyrosine-phosphatase [Algoriphagus namhaensis]|uniref:Protein-tyrosine-phosphatase n=1 Tax=Algoriphagus namhaensis TaxID=915353 RepID=A0ABV8ATM9_9BACT